MTLPDHFAPLSSAENKLVEDALSLERTSFADGALPEAAEDDVTIRADLIRNLLLSAPLNDKGIRLRGAWIKGALDLQGCDCARDTTLTACNLPEPVNLTNANLRG
ncbi:MAG: hypothetical protein OXD48_03860, partial [Litoreibacter sp.]|nr:hypothetical protein [Litoreibacter sp.]